MYIYFAKPINFLKIPCRKICSFPKDETMTCSKETMKMPTIYLHFQEATAATTEADADRVASTAIVTITTSNSTERRHIG